MDITLRAIREAEHPAYHAAMELGFGGAGRDADREIHAPVVEWDRSLAAYDGDAIVGTAAAFSFSLSVPGGHLPVAGVTGVSVVPTHRRRGLLTRMMRDQLDDVAARGEPAAALFASEGAIYSRFGYGLAAVGAQVSIDTRRGAFLPGTPRPDRVRLVHPDDAVGPLRQVHDAAAGTRPGLFARSDAWWRRRLADPEHWRGDGSPLRVAVHDEGGRPTGYAIYRTRPSWRDGSPDGTVDVVETVTVTPAAAAATWRYLLDVDLMRTVKAYHLPPDTPLLHLLSDPRAAQLRLTDNLWVRLVDVAAALRGRRYAVPGALVLEVDDVFRPDAAGRFALEAGEDGAATCERTTAAADLRLGVAELGAVFLGGTRLAALADAGRVAELTDGAVRRADHMLAWSPLPVCPEVF